MNNLLRLVGRRLVALPIMAIGVTFLVFFLMSFSPIDPAYKALGEAATPEAIQKYHEDFGLDDPWPVRYVRYMGDLLHGELGIPAAAAEDPGLYVICRKNEEKMAVGLWNFGMDIVLPQEKIRLDDSYPTILPIGKGDVMGMGNAAAYLEEIPPYCFGGFVVKK
jgi:hypothetical protein